MKPKFGIIGMGFIYPRHVEAIKHVGGEIVAVCDTDPEKLKKAPDGVFQTTDWEKVVSHRDVEYVSILTPNYLHHRMIGTALDHNKKVIVEKPPFLDPHPTEFFHKEGYQPPRLNMVLQLRYHPEVIRLKQEINPLEKHDVNMDVCMRRGSDYWLGWKGDEDKSGGILFNLGVHYFDLLLHIFGPDVEIVHSHVEPKIAIGSLEFANGRVRCTFKLHIVDEKLTDQTANHRSLTIDGKETVLSKQDNLSFEGLHNKLYEDIIAGNGIPVIQAKPALSLIKNLKSWQKVTV